MTMNQGKITNGNGGGLQNRSGLVAALDVGSTKMCCLIARPTASRDAEKQPGFEVVGIGHQVSKGIKAGAIVDMDAAENAVRATVAAAEEMAGETVRRVVVSMPGPALQSRLIAYEISVAGQQVGDADLRRILDPASLSTEVAPGHEMLHALPVGYSLDGSKGVRDPRGMFGDKLGVNLHIVSTSQTSARNLETCLSRGHLEIATKVAPAYASAQACLVDDERDLGVTCIDMGGGTTSVAVYFDGEMVFTDTLGIGGAHVTSDIARGLSTPMVHAERMKTLYGSAMPSPSDDQEIIKVPQIGEAEDVEAVQVPRSMLIGIIRPRLEETFEMVRTRLEAAGFDKVAGRRVVLVGGASQLPGIADLAGQILEKQVRIGRPRSLPGLADAMAGPAFATCCGLLTHTMNAPLDAAQSARFGGHESTGRLGRIGQWLREHF